MRALLVAASLVLPLAAGAQPSLALRVGYAPSFGSAADGLPMSQVVGAQLPVQADALWRFGRAPVEGTRPFAAGAYASYGLGLATACDSAARCSSSSFRLGLEGIFTFHSPSGSWEAWVGAGAGYEWTTRRRSRDGGEVEWAYRGVEMVSLQGGGDFLRLGRTSVGPFLLLALGRYSHLALETPVESSAGEIAGKSIHAWLEVGLRAKFDL